MNKADALQVIGVVGSIICASGIDTSPAANAVAVTICLIIAAVGAFLKWV